jgi:predicted RNase H-like nuclease (RuvC/YqgF family)
MLLFPSFWVRISQRLKQRIAAAARQQLAQANDEIKALRDKVVSLDLQLAQAKDENFSLREKVGALRLCAENKNLENENLKAGLRQVADAKTGTLFMAAADRREILRCLHPDSARDPAEQSRLTKAFQIFNALPIDEIAG